MVDQSPIGRSPRSNPVTYLKAFDEIRAVFAETVEARTRNYDAGHFSFNVDGGRCSACHGDGYLQIDMQFLADVYMKCSQCNGTRYRDEILDVTYRGRNIAEVLEMTVREAFTFFRGQPKVQARLKRLIDVGLDYVRLGQPANTLSGGEAQRLKLAGYMSAAKRGRCLFILDEPTTGLHFSDIVQLLDCFDALLAVGHSLIVVEHNLQMMKAADYIIDLGPGAADEGGRVVAKGRPEMVARSARRLRHRRLPGRRCSSEQLQRRSRVDNGEHRRDERPSQYSSTATCARCRFRDRLAKQGQRRLVQRRALVCGCGALGSAAANMLVRARRRHGPHRRSRFRRTEQPATPGRSSTSRTPRGLPKAIAAAEKLRRDQRRGRRRADRRRRGLRQRRAVLPRAWT